MRIQTHPVLSFDGNRKKVSFTFDGELFEGYEGEPIASALHAAGVRVLGHSHNGGRARGLYCAIGNCSSCLATVNGVSNVRTCIEKLKEGMVVVSQDGRGRVSL